MLSKKRWRFLLPNLDPAPESFSLGGQDAQDSPDSNSSEGATSLTNQFDTNLAHLRREFYAPTSAGLTIRTVTLGSSPAVRAAVAFVEDQVDWEQLNRTVLGPLIQETKHLTPEIVLQQILTNQQVGEADQWRDVMIGLLNGSAAVFMEGSAKAVMVDVRGPAKRSITTPKVEPVVRGPQEAFTEDLRASVSQVRRRLGTVDLVVEHVRIGSESQTDVAMIYHRRIANPKLAQEVRRRLNGISIDYIADSGPLEQLIEDHPRAFFPTILSTERPDRVAAQVAEGFVAILVNNDPFALIVPGSSVMLLHSAEDTYLRWPFGSFLRHVRIVAFAIGLLLPAIYVAAANYHHEMVPTALMMAISGARETVPLPTVLEVLLIESLFEIIREASVRVPTVIGPTIGIVGALILGQAAVQAGIISPILVIITAATALASFALPNFSMQFAIRVLRFGYIFAASALGLVGIALLMVGQMSYPASLNSFGVPWFSPLAPNRKSGDALLVAPLFVQEERPAQVRPQEMRRQPLRVRGWDAKVRPRKKDEEK